MIIGTSKQAKRLVNKLFRRKFKYKIRDTNCKICDGIREPGRSICRECQSRNVNKLNKIRLSKQSKFNCFECEQPTVKHKKDQMYCRKCYLELLANRMRKKNN